MSDAENTTREGIASLLGLHYYLTRTAGMEASCQCRQWVESVQRKPFTTWADHVADALIAAFPTLTGVPETVEDDAEFDAAWQACDLTTNADGVHYFEAGWDAHASLASPPINDIRVVLMPREIDPEPRAVVPGGAP